MIQKNSQGGDIYPKDLKDGNKGGNFKEDNIYTNPKYNINNKRRDIWHLGF